MTPAVPSPAALLSGGDPLAAPVTVLVVGDGGAVADAIDTRLAAADDIRIEAVATPSAASAHFDAADCVVGDGGVPDEELLELIGAVRRRDPALPFVLVADVPSRAVLDGVSGTPWVDYYRPGCDGEQHAGLARRIRALVGYRRTTTVASRALAAVEQATDAVAIVAPDGTVEFANQLFARQLGASTESLVGRDWRSLYPDPEVERLESDAFPSLDDGWRWIGDCEMRRDDGSTLVVQTRIDALDGGGLVFTVSDRPDESD